MNLFSFELTINFLCNVDIYLTEYTFRAKIFFIIISVYYYEFSKAFARQFVVFVDNFVEFKHHEILES